MKNNLYRLFCGELRVEISGDYTEQALNAALQQKIDIMDVKRLDLRRVVLTVELADIYQLRRVMRDTHCRMRIVNRRGVPFMLNFFYRHPILIAGIVLCSALLSFLSSLVVSLTISSPYALSEEDSSRVRQLAAEAGICEWRSRWGMDMEVAEQYILDQFRELYYVEIYQNGISLDVRVVKRVDIPPDELHLPGDLVASSAGVIVDVLVRRGTAAVKSGDTVKAGDVLIYGYYLNELAAADGIVTAKIYGEGYGECATQQTRYNKTGRVTYGVYLSLSQKNNLVLLGKTDPPYAVYSSKDERENLYIWRIINLPVEVVFRKFFELIPYQVSFTPMQANAHAKETAIAAAKSVLLPAEQTAQIKALKVTTYRIELDDGVQRVRAVAEALADIGVYQELNEEQMAAYRQFIATQQNEPEQQLQ